MDRSRRAATRTFVDCWRARGTKDYMKQGGVLPKFCRIAHLQRPERTYTLLNRESGFTGNPFDHRITMSSSSEHGDHRSAAQPAHDGRRWCARNSNT